VPVALYAGSFDPVHLGHLGIIERVVPIFQEVVVAVVANPKKAGGMFTIDERVRFLTRATAHLPTVRARHFEGLTVDLARAEGAHVLVRAAHKDTADELSMAAMNLITAEIPTIVVPADPQTRTISSSLVRQLVDAGQIAAAQELVPACVRQALVEAAAST
jgi:pantetheine-phosphate adenylyltransferase